MSGSLWPKLRDWFSILAEAVDTDPTELQDRRLNAMAARIDDLSGELEALKGTTETTGRVGPE
jgi:hypothetical protein